MLYNRYQLKPVLQALMFSSLPCLQIFHDFLEVNAMPSFQYAQQPDRSGNRLNILAAQSLGMDAWIDDFL